MHDGSENWWAVSLNDGRDNEIKMVDVTWDQNLVKLGNLVKFG